MYLFWKGTCAYRSTSSAYIAVDILKYPDTGLSALDSIALPSVALREANTTIWDLMLGRAFGLELVQSIYAETIISLEDVVWIMSTYRPPSTMYPIYI